MGHNITDRDGLFVVRQPAWHGLGKVLSDYPTREEAKAIAHPWEPTTEPLYRIVEVPEEVWFDCIDPQCGDSTWDHDCDGHHETRLKKKVQRVDEVDLVVRDDDPALVLGVKPVTRSLVKNGEMYDIAEAIMGGDGGRVLYETGGSISGGRKVWLLLRFEEPFRVGGRPGTDTIAYFALQNSNDGTAAFRGQGTNVTIVCHEAGTPILHENRWIKVEEHPSFMGMKSEAGLRVSIEGLPFTETVTLDHRYRTSKSEDRADWTYARDLEKGVTEIAYPIDMTVEEHSESEDFWWAMGLWWADGHLTSRGGIGWSVANTQPEIEERLLGFLRERGFTGKGSQRRGCKQIVAGRMPEVHQMLSEWYRGEGNGKGAREKVPSSFVERLPLNLQQSFVDGYFAGDGYTQKDRQARIFLSSSLDGLLVLRRVLMRLGQPCSIRLGRKAAHASVIEGRKVNAKDQWSLRVAANAQGVRIEDGILYSKVKLIEWVREMKAVPITTENNRYVTAFGMSSNCDNTSKMADMDAEGRGTDFAFAHTANIKERIEQAKEALAGWKESVATYQRIAEHMIEVPVTKEQRTLFIHEFIPMPQENLISARVRQNVVDGRSKMIDIFDSPTQETIRDTTWGLVQAAIEYSQHYRKAKTAESRFKRAYLDKSRLTVDALALAQEVAKA